MGQEKNQKTLVLIDGHALVHRAFHALPPLNTPKGELVNAVYGFVLVLLRVFKDLRPDYIAATFDLAAPTFRHKEFEEYKATRVKAPDELYAQISRVKEVLGAFNIPIFEKEGFEADDIIGSLAKQASRNSKFQIPNSKIIIVTGDLDTLQLINDKISVYTLKKGVKDTILYDEKAVKERFGLGPEQIADFKGLKGDPSDNIPGVPGVGEKTAAELLKKYGSIDNLYRELERPKTKTQKNQKLIDKLLENKEQAFFSRYLATIKTDVPIKFNLKDALARDYEKEKVIKLFKELGFYSLVNRFGEASQKIIDSETQPELLKSIAEQTGLTSGKEQLYERIEAAFAQNIFSKEIYELEKALVPVISTMEKNGIKIDTDYLNRLSKQVGEQLSSLENKIYQSAGAKFNINSPQQLSEILFNKLGLAVKGLKKTPGKVISTAASELEKMRGSHEIISLISEYRELAKLKNTYIDALPKLVGVDGRLHTSFDQLGTSTGRLSSKNPNLQNIPIKTELGREIRKAFVAEQGFKILSADYSQIELRVVASIAKDKNMIAAFNSDQDIHALTAAEVFDLDLKKVTPKHRQAAKTLNFGVLYGMSVHGFAQASGVDLARAKIFIEKYFNEFSGIARYVEKTKELAARQGFVQTLFGRKRVIPEINSSAWNLRAAAERMAVNMPIQGTAADLMKLAMVKLGGSLGLIADSQGFKPIAVNPRLLLQVHDELVFEVSEKELNRVAAEIKDTMENIYKLSVPLIVEIEVGENWGEMTELKV